jgi:hypothetical protein
MRIRKIIQAQTVVGKRELGTICWDIEVLDAVAEKIHGGSGGTLTWAPLG